MHRLKNKLLAMDPNTATYTAMYDGNIFVEDPNYPEMGSTLLFDPTYYNGEIGFHFSVTHKLALDRPTVVVQIPAELLGIREGTAAAADFCLRTFSLYIDALNAELYNRSRPDKENGRYYLSALGGEILVRNGSYFAQCPQKDYRNISGSKVCLLASDKERPQKLCLCIRMVVQLPRKQIKKTMRMLCKDLPNMVARYVADFDRAKLQEVLALAEKQAAIRAWLRGSDYCAFIANGSILPRSKGTQQPMANAIPFVSTPQDEIEVCGVRGMGIRRGVTVITGGGYSGKSTLLDAISTGIYDHVLGDGRELCITDVDAVTISAEDGRSVQHVNISPFIKWLPGGNTSDFSTENASGSTSQAANIMEAVDCGVKLLLIDEDRSATNFMIRDRMMKELIEKEPITPFTDRVGELHHKLGVSTILVIGGSGEYLSVADKIYKMEDYRIHDVTEQAKTICRAHGVTADLPSAANFAQSRVLHAAGFTSYPEGNGKELLWVSEMRFICIGDEQIDVRGLHDIVSPQQLNTLGFMLRLLEVTNNRETIDLESEIDTLYQKIEAEGVDYVYSSYFTTCKRFLDLPRKAELLALINRMRKIKLTKGID